MNIRSFDYNEFIQQNQGYFSVEIIINWQMKFKLKILKKFKHVLGQLVV